MKSSKKRTGLAIAVAVLASTFTLVGAEAANASLPGPPQCIAKTQLIHYIGWSVEWAYTGAWYSAGHGGYKYTYLTNTTGDWIPRGQVSCTLS